MSAPAKGQVYHCKICNLYCTGSIDYDRHINGKPHFKALQRQNDTAEPEEPPKKKMKETSNRVYFCDTCDIGFLNQESRDAHLKGVRHLKKIRYTATFNISDFPHIAESDKGYKCTLCNADNLSGPPVVISHVQGGKHQHRLISAPVTKTETSISREGNKVDCTICNIWCNTQEQLEIHQASLKHKHKAQVAAQREHSTVQGNECAPDNLGA